MIIPILILAVGSLAAQASVTGYFGADEHRELLKPITKAFPKLQKGDVSTVYYGARGYKLLNESLVKVFKMDACSHISRNLQPDAPPEPYYRALYTFINLDCVNIFPDNKPIYNEDKTQQIKAVLSKQDSSIVDIRFALESLVLLKTEAPNPNKVAQIIQERLKEDDNLINLGHMLHAAALLGPAGKFALQRVEDIVVQADEIDGTMLQWEGGLTITGMILDGLYRLPGTKPLTQAQADKFASYLSSRMTVQNPRGAVALVEGILALAGSDVSPVCLTLVGSAQITAENSNLIVRVSDLLGNPVKPAITSVVAQSATRVADDVVVLSKQPFTADADKVTFTLPLKLEPGQYRIALTAGTHSTTITVRTLGPVDIQWLEVGLGDADGTSLPRFTRLQHSATLSSVLQADSSQHLIVRFLLSRSVHQAFVILNSQVGEIVFVAEQDNSKIYKADIDLATDVGKSGVFDIELILGDSLISNPLQWKIGNVDITLNAPEPPPAPFSGAKPEIKHMFRVAEKRPPQTVSMLFTALVASPLLLLLILWARIGVNVGNFSFSAVPFHLGLASIFGLFGLFWLKLNMFVTCGWLLPLGGFTFLAGHRLLSKIASQRKH